MFQISKANLRRALGVLCIAGILGVADPAHAARCLTVQGVTNNLVASSEVAPNCSQYMVITGSEYTALQDPFHTSTLHSDDVIWSFEAMVVIWACGLGIGLVISAVRKAR